MHLLAHFFSYRIGSIWWQNCYLLHYIELVPIRSAEAFPMFEDNKFGLHNRPDLYLHYRFFTPCYWLTLSRKLCNNVPTIWNIHILPFNILCSYCALAVDLEVVSDLWSCYVSENYSSHWVYIYTFRSVLFKVIIPLACHYFLYTFWLLWLSIQPRKLFNWD